MFEKMSRGAAEIHSSYGEIGLPVIFHAVHKCKKRLKTVGSKVCQKPCTGHHKPVRKRCSAHENKADVVTNMQNAKFGEK